MIPAPSDSQVAAVRAFNRFYTRKLGALDQHLLDSPFSLAEARVLYELAQHEAISAKEIGVSLGLDAGYLSRIVQSFDEKGLISRTPLPSDRRQQQLSLTAKGRQAFAKLDRSSQREIAAMLAPLAPELRDRLVGAMATIETALEPAQPQRSPVLLRSHRPGDIGWVIARHGAVYAEEYGWNAGFEALVAEIGALFIRNYDPAREHCWIAELAGEPVGSIFLVKGSDDVAKLRLLLVEKKARGLGVGRALTEQCIRFARETHYKTIELWTQSILTAARDIYARAGFRKIAEEPHASFGVQLMGETWRLEL
ncbi:putative transcriptional regulator, MarR family; N-acetyltransferase [Bradyrhizobium sp. ORS 375]|uniref:bifunctional helix-turn-helix transcriptional regulator/GNAT family N-acetyltransferase n=1 Tax=Bradyrhizobium sp. (strain ORS 375) TaxID=566679 RepID=UPI0002405853|nr:bifunctional helix-turn-helix transcriptional regulator/GNAT family N-acetyltransferase [Bradyrhizobium sp. ORS 375]CCD94133.1 putative transcriptional regulator, MarR family; N-acetyltransferase [Bradyrhizobium sp. ORS 375]